MVAYLPETPRFPAVRAYEKETVALGGDENAPVNKPLVDLTERTAWLKAAMGVRGVWDMSTARPTDATDGLWYQVSAEGTFGGRQAAAGDFVMFYANMTRILVLPADGGGLDEGAINTLIEAALAGVLERLTALEEEPAYDNPMLPVHDWDVTGVVTTALLEPAASHTLGGAIAKVSDDSFTLTLDDTLPAMEGVKYGICLSGSDYTLDAIDGRSARLTAVIGGDAYSVGFVVANSGASVEQVKAGVSAVLGQRPLPDGVTHLALMHVANGEAGCVIQNGADLPVVGETIFPVAQGDQLFLSMAAEEDGYSLALNMGEMSFRSPLGEALRTSDLPVGQGLRLYVLLLAIGTEVAIPDGALEFDLGTTHNERLPFTGRKVEAARAPLQGTDAGRRYNIIGTSNFYRGVWLMAGTWVEFRGGLPSMVAGGVHGDDLQALVRRLVKPVNDRLQEVDSRAVTAETSAINALSEAGALYRELHLLARSAEAIRAHSKSLATPPSTPPAFPLGFYLVTPDHYAGWGVPESFQNQLLLAWHGPNPTFGYSVETAADGSHWLDTGGTPQWNFLWMRKGRQVYLEDEQAWFKVTQDTDGWALTPSNSPEGGIALKGDWDMTGATTIPYADPARDVGMETIDPQSVDIARMRITAGGVPVYNGMAYMHHQSSDRVVTNTGDLREAWTELPDFGADNGAINVMLMVMADEAMTAQDLLDALLQVPAAAEKAFYYFAWMWSPARTNFVMSTRNGGSRSAMGDSAVFQTALPVGTPLALRMDWATGRPSIVRQDNSTALLTATNCQLRAPAGMRFRPWTFAMTVGTDALSSTQAVPIQYSLGNSLASGFVGVGDAELPAGAQVGDAFVVTAPGNYGGKSAEAGDTVVLHPTTGTMQVFKGARGATLAEIAAAGYQTKAQIDATVPPDPAVTYALARRHFAEQWPVSSIDGEDPAERPFGEIRVVGANPTGTVLGTYWPGDLVITGADAFHRYRPLPGERWYLTALWDVKPIEMIYLGRGQNSGDPTASLVLDGASSNGYVSPYPLWRSRVAVPLATDVELVNTAVSPAPDGSYRVSVLTDMARLLGITDSSPDVEILFVTDPETVALGATAHGTIAVVSQAGYYKRFKLNGGSLGSARSLTAGVERDNGIWIGPGESLIIRWYMSLLGGNTAINFAVDRWNYLQGGVAQASFSESTMTVEIAEPVSVIRVSAVPGLTNRQLSLNGFAPSQDQELTLLIEQDIGLKLSSNGGYDFVWPQFKVMKKGRAYRFKYERAGSYFYLVSDGDGVMPSRPDEVLVVGNYMLSVSDLGKTLVLPPGTPAVVLTCRDDLQFDPGWWCEVWCRSANGASFAGDNTSLESIGGKVALGQFARAKVRKQETGVFGLSGDLS